MSPKMMLVRRILLIEDDLVFIRTFAATLLDEGYDVQVSGSAEGPGARKGPTDKDRGIDMIISDQRMPGEAGASFLSFLAELEKCDNVTSLDPSSHLYQEVRHRFTGMDDAGFKALLQSMKVQPHYRVILSGYSSDDSVKKAVKDGKIHAFISKQTPPSEVLATIKSLFDSGKIPLPERLVDEETVKRLNSVVSSHLNKIATKSK